MIVFYVILSGTGGYSWYKRSCSFLFFLGVSMGASVGADSKKVNWQPHGMEIKSKKKPTNSRFII